MSSISLARSALWNIKTTLQRTAAAAPSLQRARAFASVVPHVPASSSTSKLPRKVEDARKPGALRPHYGVEVDPSHGLYAFFRKKVEDGVTKYETLEAMDIATMNSGRAWTAAELRRKSFKDLHTLWYVLLRERNLLATQREEARRTGIHEQQHGLAPKVYRVRKSMARIKYVINERRLGYEGAVQIFQERVSRRLTRREQKRQEHKQFLVEKAKQKELRDQAEKATETEERVHESHPANIAAAGLFAAGLTASSSTKSSTTSVAS